MKKVYTSTKKTNSCWRLSLILLCFVLNLEGGICANGDDGRWRWPSPDSQWTLFVRQNDQETCYSIKNNTTGKFSGQIPAYTLPVYIKWVDSEHIIVIEHIANSSILRELAVKNNKWITIDIGVPDDWRSFHVVAINTKKHIATFRCRVVRGEYSFVGAATFDCNLNTGDISNIKYQELSQSQFDHLDDLGNMPYQ
jgi:hypothetical protein